MWSGLNSPKAPECYASCRFFTVFHIKCRYASQDEREKLEKSIRGFIAWVRSFTKENNIQFPHIEGLFIKLTYCSLDSLGISQNQQGIESPYITSTEKMIKKIYKDSINQESQDSFETIWDNN